LLKLPSIIEVIKSHNIAPQKMLGQNFLLDTHLTDQIVNAVGDLADKSILEIGAGPGCLTRSLLASAARRVIAIETDERCVDALKVLTDAYPNKLEVIKGNALKIDEAAFGEQKLVIIANLPYNIGTALILKWLNTPSLFESINVMLQKEVVDRICAKPSTPDYGRLSIICQWLCQVEELMLIEPENFFPPPKVMSCVVRLTPLAQPRFNCTQSSLEKVTHQAFAQRRKMLRSSLKGLISEAEIESLGIAATKRAEELTLEEFCNLANLL
jgi:16S rRNA (adenine1518-N6/adenine1519-N6)-dimethyltransferase